MKSQSWQFPPDLHGIQPIVEQIKSIANACFPDDPVNLFPLELVLREALNNAIIHGGKHDQLPLIPTPEIDLDVGIDDHSIHITIDDHGNGLPHLSQIPWADPLAESGRGWRILSQFCSQVEIHAGSGYLHLKLPLTSLKETTVNQPHTALFTMALIKSTSRDDLMILIPQTDILASNIAALRGELKALLQAVPPSLQFDLSRVKVMDSSGIGLLIATYNSLRERDGKMEVTGASPDIEALLCSMCLDRHFPVNGKSASN